MIFKSVKKLVARLSNVVEPNSNEKHLQKMALICGLATAGQVLTVAHFPSSALSGIVCHPNGRQKLRASGAVYQDYLTHMQPVLFVSWDF